MRTQYPEDYEKVWKKWPGRWREDGVIVKVGKVEGLEVWLGKERCFNGTKMDDEDREDAAQVILSGKVKRAGTRLLKDFHRWLKLRRWEDF